MRRRLDLPPSAAEPALKDEGVMTDSEIKEIVDEVEKTGYAESWEASPSDLSGPTKSRSGPSTRSAGPAPAVLESSEILWCMIDSNQADFFVTAFEGNDQQRLDVGRPARATPLHPDRSKKSKTSKVCMTWCWLTI